MTSVVRPATVGGVGGIPGPLGDAATLRTTGLAPPQPGRDGARPSTVPTGSGMARGRASLEGPPPCGPLASGSRTLLLIRRTRRRSSGTVSRRGCRSELPLPQRRPGQDELPPSPAEGRYGATADKKVIQLRWATLRSRMTSVVRPATVGKVGGIPGPLGDAATLRTTRLATPQLGRHGGRPSTVPTGSGMAQGRASLEAPPPCGPLASCSRTFLLIRRTRRRSSGTVARRGCRAEVSAPKAARGRTTSAFACRRPLRGFGGQESHPATQGHPP